MAAARGGRADTRPDTRPDTEPLTLPVPTPNWTKPAVGIRIIDGDTFVGRIDLGRYWGGAKQWLEGSIRINGLWSPEINQVRGRLAKDTLEALVVDKPLVVQTLKPSPNDVYGRVVANVWVPLLGDNSVASMMIMGGYGFATKAELERWLSLQSQ